MDLDVVGGDATRYFSWVAGGVELESQVKVVEMLLIVGAVA